MRLSDELANPVVLAELGARLARRRLERNLTQGEMAAEAGIGRATLQRLERGESVQLGSLISVLRLLGIIDGLEMLVPEVGPSPIEQLEMQGRRRQRATGRRARSTPTADTWTWGDDEPGGTG